MIAHHVYFSLVDPSAGSRARLIAACRQHLTGHAGTVFFGVGEVVPDLARPVNDRDFDVALCLVFETRAAHDAYQVDGRHQLFMLENRASWKRVRVFDADVA